MPAIPTSKALQSPQQRIRQLERDIERMRHRAHGIWHYVGDTDEPAFLNSWDNSGGTLQTLRFRLLLGGGIELQGSIVGGASGTVVFTLPTGYAPENELRLTATDDTGAIVVIRILANGDVYAGL